MHYILYCDYQLFFLHTESKLDHLVLVLGLALGICLVVIFGLVCVICRRVGSHSGEPSIRPSFLKRLETIVLLWRYINKIELN